MDHAKQTTLAAQAQRDNDVYNPQRTVLVTGASSGIGAAVAEYLAPFGVRIGLFARREAKLRSLEARLATLGAAPLVLPGDTTDIEAVRHAHDQIIAQLGPVDVAFLNAGVGDSFTLASFSAKRVKRVLDVNVIGVVNWLEVLLPSMLERRFGTVVGISSLASGRGFPFAGAYSASKAALSVLLESIRVEAQSAGIQVCTVEPGFIRSEMTDRNKFPMPFLMDTGDAARLICEAAARRERLVRFPWQTAAAAALLRWLPGGLYDRLVAQHTKRRKTKRRTDNHGSDPIGG